MNETQPTSAQTPPAAQKKAGAKRHGQSVRVMLPGSTVDPRTASSLEDWQAEMGLSRGKVIDALAEHARSTGFAPLAITA